MQYEAEHLSRLLVDPVAEIVDAVRILGVEICLTLATSLAETPLSMLCTSMSSGMSSLSSWSRPD